MKIRHIMRHRNGFQSAELRYRKLPISSQIYPPARERVRPLSQSQFSIATARPPSAFQHTRHIIPVVANRGDSGLRTKFLPERERPTQHTRLRRGLLSAQKFRARQSRGLQPMTPQWRPGITKPRCPVPRNGFDEPNPFSALRQTQDTRHRRSRVHTFIRQMAPPNSGARLPPPHMMLPPRRREPARGPNRAGLGQLTTELGH